VQSTEDDENPDTPESAEADGETTNIRRSQRKRKEISYKGTSSKLISNYFNTKGNQITLFTIRQNEFDKVLMKAERRVRLTKLPMQVPHRIKR
jgi:hypothetical protein